MMRQSVVLAHAAHARDLLALRRGAAGDVELRINVGSVLDAYAGTSASTNGCVCPGDVVDWRTVGIVCIPLIRAFLARCRVIAPLRRTGRAGVETAAHASVIEDEFLAAIIGRSKIDVLTGSGCSRNLSVCAAATRKPQPSSASGSLLLRTRSPSLKASGHAEVGSPQAREI